MKDVVREVKEKGECELYSPSPTPWVDGGARVRITLQQSGNFRTAMWLTGDKYFGPPSIREFESLDELKGYLKRYSFI
jgi:hypothetical protein